MYIHDEYNEILKFFQHNTLCKTFAQTLSTMCELFQRCKFMFDCNVMQTSQRCILCKKFQCKLSQRDEFMLSKQSFE